MSIGSIAASLSSVQQQLSPAPSAKDTRTAEQAHKAAVEFEGLTIGELIQPMFDTVDTSNDMFGGGGGGIAVPVAPGVGNGQADRQFRWDRPG